MAAATASAWAGTFESPAALDERRQQRQADGLGDEAHEQEAHRLVVCDTLARVERPVPVPHEVVRDRDDPRAIEAIR